MLLKAFRGHPCSGCIICMNHHLFMDLFMYSIAGRAGVVFLSPIFFLACNLKTGHARTLGKLIPKVLREQLLPPLGARKTSSLTASRPHRRSWLVAKATTWVRKREDDARWSYTRQLPGPGSWEPGTQRLTRPGCWGPLGMMAGPLSCLSSLHGSRSSRLPGLSAGSLLLL